MANFSPALHSLSLHDYPTTTCLGLSVGVAEVASRASSHGAAETYRPFIAAGEQHGVPLVIGEANSASCGGQANVSNAMVGALWAIDYLSSMSQAGAAGVNFHGTGFDSDPEPYYAPYAFASDGTPLVRALYYGLWAFATLVAGDDSRWLTVDADYTAGYPAFANTAVHAVSSGNGSVVRVAVVGKETHGDAAAQAANVTLALDRALSFACAGQPATTASLVRLQAAGGRLDATGPFTFGGQTFDGSTDGRPVGEKRVEHVAVRLVAGQPTVTFTLGVAEAAVVSVTCRA